MWRRFWIGVVFVIGCCVTDDVYAKEERVILYEPIEAILEEIEEEQVVKTYDEWNMATVTLEQEQIDQLRTQFPRAIIQMNQEYALDGDRDISSANQVNATRRMTSPYGGEGVKVAVVDSGVDVRHKDLNIQGGYCSSGIDCAQNVPFHDDNGHGTHVAGIIAARANGVGLVGIAPNVQLYAIKAMNQYGLGTSASLIDAIYWTMKHDIDVVNLSINTPRNDPSLQRALEEAYNKGMIIVGSVGNNGLEAMNKVTYPAKYDTVIGVAAVDRNGRKLPKSAIGPEVELSAPGERVESTYPLSWDFEDGVRDGYTRMSGTSMATPHVTAIVALYKERFPYASNDDIRRLLQETAADLGEPGHDPLYGHGLVQYIPYFEATAKLGVTQQKGKALVRSLNHPIVSLTMDGKKMTNQDAYEIYGVRGLKAVDIETTTRKGERFIERQYVSIHSPNYQDVHNRQAFARAIGYLSHHEQIQGFDDQTFRPYKEMTRAEAVTLIGRALQLDGTLRETEFEDVSPKSFASGYIQSVVDAKVASGFKDGTFRPNALVTRGEMAILLTRAFELKSNAQATDLKDVAPHMASYEAIRALRANNVTQGFTDQTFRPYAPMTRADFSLFLARTQDEQFR